MLEINKNSEENHAWERKIKTTVAESGKKK
jgi:hypothetical protein